MGLKARSRVRFGALDGWILAAAAHAGADGRVATWRQLIASADYLEHATPTHRQLGCAVARLEAVGHLRLMKTGVVVAPAVLARVPRVGGSLRRRYADVWRLPAPALAPTPMDNPIPYRDYQRAVAIHRAWG